MKGERPYFELSEVLYPVQRFVPSKRFCTLSKVMCEATLTINCETQCACSGSKMHSKIRGISPVSSKNIFKSLRALEAEHKHSRQLQSAILALLPNVIPCANLDELTVMN